MSIPASQIVNVVPSVISAGGNQTATVGLILTDTLRIPLGTVASYPSAAAVSAVFGAGSNEAVAAALYFTGPNGATQTPANLLMASYNTADASAYVWGASAASLSYPLAGTYSGALNITVDGSTFSTTPDLTSAASGSAAAATISTALAGAVPTIGTVTGSISGTTLTVTVAASPILAAGQAISGTGVTAGTYIVSQLTGTTGGVGTYKVSAAQTAGSTTITVKPQVPVCTYDSTTSAFVITSSSTGAPSTITAASGALATKLFLTTATGAQVSQGAAAATPATFMTALYATNANWASFCAIYAVANSDKVAFAAWASGYPVIHVSWSTNAAATVVPDTTTALSQIIAAGYGGTVGIYAPTNTFLAAVAVLSFCACLDFGRTNARATLAFKSFTGLVADVTDATTASNLLANSYNFIGGYATAAQGYTFANPGSITGAFKWVDSYIDQIWLNNALQLSLMTMLTTSPSIPYNQAGYSLIKSACAGPINAALNFGAIRTGVILSPLQISEVNAAAGQPIDAVLSTDGYYLQVKDPGATVRAARGSPICTLWYMDGQSVQKITLASVSVQ